MQVKAVGMPRGNGIEGTAPFSVAKPDQNQSQK